MDVRTEQAYQQRIAALEACVVDLETQLTQRDATIAALQQQVADLSKQVVDLLAQLAKVIQKASTAMAESHLALQRMLPSQDILNVDESGHKENGRRLWTWGFRAAIFTCFKIDPSRGSQVLRAVLGEDFTGTLGCDYFSAYHITNIGKIPAYHCSSAWCI